jgi:hypothetical protein
MFIYCIEKTLFFLVFRHNSAYLEMFKIKCVYFNEIYVSWHVHTKFYTVDMFRFKFHVRYWSDINQD